MQKTITVHRDGGFGDILIILYFCKYYHTIGYKIQFITHSRFHGFLIQQPFIDSVFDKKCTSSDIDIDFNAIEHHESYNQNHLYNKFDISKIRHENVLNSERRFDITNASLYDIFYKFANTIIPTEPEFFTLNIPFVENKTVQQYYSKLKRPIICVNHISTTFNRTLNIHSINELFTTCDVGTLVNVSPQYAIAHQCNVYEVLPQSFEILIALIYNCNIVFTTNTSTLHIANNLHKPTIAFNTSWNVDEYNINNNKNFHILESISPCTNCRLHSCCMLDENIKISTHNADFHVEQTPICCNFNSKDVIKQIKIIAND